MQITSNPINPVCRITLWLETMPNIWTAEGHNQQIKPVYQWIIAQEPTYRSKKIKHFSSTNEIKNRTNAFIGKSMKEIINPHTCNATKQSKSNSKNRPSTKTNQMTKTQITRSETHAYKYEKITEPEGLWRSSCCAPWTPHRRSLQDAQPAIPAIPSL